MMKFLLVMLLTCTLCASYEDSHYQRVKQAAFTKLRMMLFDDGGDSGGPQKTKEKCMEELVDGVNIIIQAAAPLIHHFVKEDNALKKKLVEEILLKADSEEEALEAIGNHIIHRVEDVFGLIGHAAEYAEKTKFNEKTEAAVKKVIREVEEEGYLDNEELSKFFMNQVKTASDGKRDGPYVKMGVAAGLAGNRFLTIMGKLIDKMVKDYSEIWAIKDPKERAIRLARKFFADIRRAFIVMHKLECKLEGKDCRKDGGEGEGGEQGEEGGEKGGEEGGEKGGEEGGERGVGERGGEGEADFEEGNDEAVEDFLQTLPSARSVLRAVETRLHALNDFRSFLADGRQALEPHQASDVSGQIKKQTETELKIGESMLPHNKKRPLTRE